MKIYGGGYLDERKLAEMGVAKVGRNVKVHEQSVLVGLENMEFGDNVRIDAFCVIVCADNGKLCVGNHVHIASQVLLSASHGFEINDFSGISHGVKVFTGSDDFSGHYLTGPTVPEAYTKVQKAKVTIGRHVIVGAGAVILPGANLGEGVAIGALSVVVGDLKEWAIYKGNPARQVRSRSRDLLEKERQLKAGLAK